MALALSLAAPAFVTATHGNAEEKVRTLCAPEETPSLDGCEFLSFTAAIEALGDGDRLRIRPGVFREAAVLRANGVTIVAEPGAAIEGTAAEGKAALVIRGNDTVIEGLECSGIEVADLNGACIRLNGRNLTLRQVYFHDSQQGLLSGTDSGTVLIEDSVFERLGAVGKAHGIYVSGGEHLIVRNSRIVSAKDHGHEIKSRARKTTIENNVIGSGLGDDSRTIDLPNGGDILIRNNVIQMGPNSVNRDMIGIGLEAGAPQHESNNVIIEGNTLILDRTGRVLNSEIPVQMIDNHIVAGTPTPGNQWYADRQAAGLGDLPALDRVPEDGVEEEDRFLEKRLAALQKQKEPSIRLDNGRVTWQGKDVNLTEGETAVLAIMLERPNKPASFDQLYEALAQVLESKAGSAEQRRETVMQVVTAMRRKFREVDNSFAAVAFRPGEGFFWSSEP